MREASCVKNMLSRQCLSNRRGFRVIDFTTTECVLFPELFAKPSVLQFDQRQGSSDGGAILLKAAERRYGLIGSLAGCLRDKRQAGKVDHPLRELLAQRVFSIACGYPDANDSARLGADPVHKMLLDRDPVTGLDLASQPTLSRFENAVGAKDLYRMGETLAERVIERHAKRLRGHALGQGLAHAVEILRSDCVLKARQRRLGGQIKSRNRVAIQQHLMHRIGPQPRRIVGIRVAACDREHALRQQLAQRMIDLARLPLVSQASSQTADQSVAALGRLQQDGSAIGAALTLIELQYGWLGEKFGKQYTLCRGKVDHAEASPVTQTLS